MYGLGGALMEELPIEDGKVTTLSLGEYKLPTSMDVPPQVELRRRNVVVARGRGCDALGGPVEAVSWLLRVRGVEGLRAGAIVTTGTLTAALPVAPGESWRWNSTGRAALGQVQVSLS